AESGQVALSLAQQRELVALTIRQRLRDFGAQALRGVMRRNAGSAERPAGAAADAELQAELPRPPGGITESLEELRREERLVPDALRRIVERDRVGEAGHHPADAGALEEIELIVDLLARPG